ncbi:hypothetical protein D3C78_1293200 [compost metagenome]
MTAAEDRSGSQAILDAEQLVVLGDAVRTGRCARFDLAGVRSDCDVGDRAVFGFAGMVGNNGRVACAFSHFDRVDWIFFYPASEQIHELSELVGLAFAFAEDVCRYR